MTRKTVFLFVFVIVSFALHGRAMAAGIKIHFTLQNDTDVAMVSDFSRG